MKRIVLRLQKSVHIKLLKEEQQTLDNMDYWHIVSLDITYIIAQVANSVYHVG